MQIVTRRWGSLVMSKRSGAPSRASLSVPRLGVVPCLVTRKVLQAARHIIHVAVRALAPP